MIWLTTHVPLIDRVCRVRGANAMISATHSHTGPIVDTKSPFGGQSSLVKRFREALPGKIAEAVRQAESRLDAASPSR